MKELIDFYEARIANYTSIRSQLKKNIYWIGTLRLLVFVLALITVWFCRNLGWHIWGGASLVYLAPFIGLMMYHTRLFDRKMYAEAMIELNSNERKGIDYDFSAFDEGSDLIDTQHCYSYDLDLFGNQSVFQSMNRTNTWMGRMHLADWLNQPLSNRLAIEERQCAVRELVSKTDFRQHFYVTGIGENGSEKDASRLQELTHRKTNLSGSLFWKAMIWFIPFLWIITTAVCVMGLVPYAFLGTVFTLSFFIANWQVKKINQIYQSANAMERVLRTYSSLMYLIESETFDSELMQSIQSQLLLNNTKASEAIRKISKHIGALDQRFSMAGVLINLFMLRDVRQVMSLEKWIDSYAAHFDAWFESLALTDALCSLGGFGFNHPDYVYPEIADHYFQMQGKALGHPLLNREQCVRNDLSIAKNPYFLVITGANMAGKSTYLRTIGVNFVLACIGVPVCAESLTLYPAQLVTSLRTADSLMASESYFYAELKRMRMIIERLNAGEELFIILDEILRGTNSKDKQKGSLGLVKQLINKKTCGIIATHDLLLGSLEQEFPDEIKNYHFEADILNDELSFTYKLREGVAQNMNATFLMKKMGITVE